MVTIYGMSDKIGPLSINLEKEPYQMQIFGESIENEIGKEVKKGDTLCIIEAMKLMNEIESEYDGKIAKILVKDGEPVEYGTQLFVIE